jgi:hypothetical protein
VFIAIIDALDAEGTFFNHAARSAGNFRDSPGGDVGILPFPFLPVELTSIIRTSDLAVPAADATVVVHHDQTIVAYICGLHGTYFYTGRMLTVQTGSTEVEGLPSGGLVFDDDVPGFSGAHIIGGITRSLAVFAADAFVQIDDHAPVAFFNLLMFVVLLAQLPLFEGAKRG